jgi:hypothetical protein
MRWMAFMRSMDSAQATPNDQAKLDHFFEGFSVAANRNVNCALDELRWPISSNVRTWVDTNIGTVQQNPDCAIGANGKSRLLDMHAEFWAPTTANNRSDVNGAGFTSLATVAYPGTINSHGNDRTQSLRVDGVAGQAVTYYFCSPPGGYAGGVLIWRGGTGIDGPGFTPGRCNSTVLTPAANAIPWFEVRSGSGNSAGNHGAFSIVAAPAPPSAWLSRDWGRLAVVQSSVTGEFTMTVSAVDASKVTPSSSIFPGPRKVRFWAENYGWVAEVPWTAGATTYVARWTPPAGAPPGIEFRAQVYANAQHGYASQQTRPVLFRDLIFRNGFQ